LFVDNMKVYIYPTIPSVSLDNREPVGDLLTSKDIIFPDDYEDLLRFLIKNKKIIDVTEVKKKWLYINSSNVLRMIRSGEEGWEDMVPKYIEKEIKEKGLFGYQEEINPTPGPSPKREGNS